MVPADTMQPQQQQQQQQAKDQEAKQDEIDRRELDAEMSRIVGDLLLDDNYSIEYLLERARDKNLNLRELRDQLIKHQQELQQTSLELFNNSYDRFFKLSHLIACLAEPIKHVIQPVQNYRNHLGQLCQQHDNYLQDIDKRLAALEDTSRNKQIAERLLALIRWRDRIFEQVHRIEWLKYTSVDTIFKQHQQQQQQQQKTNSISNDSITFTVNCDSIERIYIELHYLICEISAIQPTSDELIPIKKSLESSAHEQQRRLGDWFADVFYHAIQVQDRTFIDFILRTYEQRGDFKELDSVWRQQVVRPYLNILLESDSRLVDQVQQTYTLLRQFLDKHVDLIGQRPFVTRSFWIEVSDSFEKLKQLYSSDDIRTFRERYEMTRNFLEAQDNDGQESQANIRRILNKFDLQGYFNQKSTEIRTSIEASLMQQPLSELPPDANRLKEPKFDLKICLQIYQLIIKCWSPEIYIDALDNEFMQLVCRILDKFAGWLSRLSLSDFRIVGTSGQQDRMTNFLAKQDAIMRLLIEDCTKLMSHIEQFESNLPKVSTADGITTCSRRETLLNSLAVVRSGLDNVRNLQKLLER